VQERLGHASIQITLDTYSHIVPGLQEAAAKSFDELLGNKQQNELEKTAIEKLLYGRPMGRAGRGYACCGCLRTECNSDYLQAGWQKIYHHEALRDEK
jgi:hypothetical protein